MAIFFFIQLLYHFSVVICYHEHYLVLFSILILINIFSFKCSFLLMLFLRQLRISGRFVQVGC